MNSKISVFLLALFALLCSGSVYAGNPLQSIGENYARVTYLKYVELVKSRLITKDKSRASIHSDLIVMDISPEYIARVEDKFESFLSTMPNDQIIDYYEKFKRAENIDQLKGIALEEYKTATTQEMIDVFYRDYGLREGEILTRPSGKYLFMDTYATDDYLASIMERARTGTALDNQINNLSGLEFELLLSRMLISDKYGPSFDDIELNYSSFAELRRAVRINLDEEYPLQDLNVKEIYNNQLRLKIYGIPISFRGKIIKDGKLIDMDGNSVELDARVSSGVGSSIMVPQTKAIAVLNTVSRNEQSYRLDMNIYRMCIAMSCFGVDGAERVTLRDVERVDEAPSPYSYIKGSVYNQREYIEREDRIRSIMTGLPDWESAHYSEFISRITPALERSLGGEVTDNHLSSISNAISFTESCSLCENESTLVFNSLSRIYSKVKDPKVKKILYDYAKRVKSRE